MNSRPQTSRGRVRDLIPPLVYALIFPATFFLFFGVLYDLVSFDARSEFLYGIPFVGFGVVYIVCGVLLLRYERLTRPRFVDHLRHSSLMYAGFLITFVIMALGFFSAMFGEHNWFTEDLWLRGLVRDLFLFVIVIDAVILTLARLRSHLFNHRISARSSV